MLSVASSVSTGNAEGPGDCGSEVFVAEEIDRLGHKGSRDTTELLRVLYVNKIETYRLLNVFLNRGSTGVSGVSGSGLIEFCCSLFSSVLPDIRDIFNVSRLRPLARPIRII